jgi:outer membrane murein-binding lipoprotein Lpp
MKHLVLVSVLMLSSGCQSPAHKELAALKEQVVKLQKTVDQLKADVALIKATPKDDAPVRSVASPSPSHRPK